MAKTYDAWKATEPTETGEACLDCHRREATASDGRCEECAGQLARTLSDELYARELAADAGEECF